MKFLILFALIAKIISEKVFLCDDKNNTNVKLVKYFNIGSKYDCLYSFYGKII